MGGAGIGSERDFVADSLYPAVLSEPPAPDRRLRFGVSLALLT